MFFVAAPTVAIHPTFSFPGFEYSLVTKPSGPVDILQYPQRMHSSETLIIGREAEQFAMINDLSRLADLSTYILDRSGNWDYALDLACSSVPFGIQAFVFFFLLAHRAQNVWPHPKGV